MGKIQDRTIGRFIVPGWLPAWIHTQIEMGADLERLAEENEAMLEQLVRHRRWLVLYGPFHLDHACADCIDSGANVDGFRCVYHEAVRISTEVPGG